MSDQHILQPPHPWEYIKDEIQTRWRTQHQFATIIGKSDKEVSELINQKINITSQRALLIAAALWTSPDVRMNIQQKCDIYRAMNTLGNKRLQQVTKIAKKYS